MSTTRATQGLVSVVVPAFNAEATIQETLESALAQTYCDLEILVVDDGSRDGTAEIVAALAKRDPRLCLLSKPNGGLSSARNYGAAHTRGQLIALLDADDLWHPSKIAKQVAALRHGDPCVGLVYCFHRFVDAAGCVCAPDFAWRYEGDVYAALVWRNFVALGSTALIRKDCLEVVGGFDESLRDGCEDLKFALALAERYDYAVVPEFLVGYRQAPESMSQNVRAIKRAYDRVLADARGRHPELPACVFRWSESAVCWYLVKRSWRSNQALPALRHLIPALVRDPASVRTLSPGRAVARKTKRWAHGLRRARGAAGDPDEEPFGALPTSVRHGPYAWSPTPLEVERREFVRACRIRREPVVPRSPLRTISAPGATP